MIEIYDMGKTTYEKAEEKQQEIYNYVLNNEKTSGVLLFLEVEPVITTTYSSNSDELVFPREKLKEQNIKCIKVNRGGKTTLHGIGQLICYPILNLEKFQKDLHKYLRNLEEVVINTLEEQNIKGSRKDRYTGVWVEDEKICAMGIHVKKWITTHGVAINNTIDLTLFDYIVPCGIKEFKVTSMEKLGVSIKRDILKDNFIRNFKKVFKT